MALTLNTILAGSGIEPETVRVLRHQDTGSLPGRTPYHLWRNDRQAFDAYQSVQKIKRRKTLGESDPLWAVFVAPPTGETLFIGLWQAHYVGLNSEYLAWRNANGGDPAGSIDTYNLTPLNELSDLIGRLIIEWTGGPETGFNTPFRRIDQTWRSQSWRSAESFKSQPFLDILLSTRHSLQSLVYRQLGAQHSQPCAASIF